MLGKGCVNQQANGHPGHLATWIKTPSARPACGSLPPEAARGPPQQGHKARPCPLTMRQGDAGAVQDGLRQLMVVGLSCIGGGLEGVPDLLAALEGGCCVPELVPFAPQLPVSHGVVTLPLQPLLLQGLVASWAGREGQAECL